MPKKTYSVVVTFDGPDGTQEEASNVIRELLTLAEEALRANGGGSSEISVSQVSPVVPYQLTKE